VPEVRSGALPAAAARQKQAEIQSMLGDRMSALKPGHEEHPIKGGRKVPQNARV
jgi:hypothetical protein